MRLPIPQHVHNVIIEKGEYKGPHFDQLDKYVEGTEVAPPPCWGRDIDGQLMIRCYCGCWMRLNHAVDNQGNVSPSIYHPKGDWMDCGWHVYGVLKDYK